MQQVETDYDAYTNAKGCLFVGPKKWRRAAIGGGLLVTAPAVRGEYVLLTYYLRLTSYYLLFATYYSLRTTYCVLLATYYLLLTAPAV